jgi:MFS family permease
LQRVAPFFNTLYLGSLIAQFLSGFLTGRFGYRLVLIVSVTILGFGIPDFTNSHSIIGLLVLTFITGLGQGDMDPGVNLAIADAYPKIIFQR